MSLERENIQIIKSTYPLLSQKGLAITEKMYEILFAQYPECEKLFSQSSNQPAKLAHAMLQFIKHVEDIDGMLGQLRFIAEKHTQSAVKAIHYPMVADALISSMKIVIGETVFNSEVAEAWTQGFMLLASELMKIEAQIYASDYQQSQVG